MKNKLFYVEDYTVVVNQDIFHRNNECKWKYVGTWGDMLEDTSKQLIKKSFSENELSELFITFGHYTSILEIVKENLVKRNKEIQKEILKIKKIFLAYQTVIVTEC